MLAQSICSSRFAILACCGLLLAGCSPERLAKERTPESSSPAAAETPLAPAAGSKQSATPIPLRAEAPRSYVVQKGDTLWDLSGKFLSEPWYWPELWSANPQIRNPNLIYPGDVLTLYSENGRPRLSVTGGPRIAATEGDGSAYQVKLSPRVREEALDVSGAGIPIQSVGPFLTRPLIVGGDELAHSAYILSSEDGRLIFGVGDQIYVRGISSAPVGARYSVFRPGQKFVDSKTREVLGFEAIGIGNAKVLKAGDPATVVLTDTSREAVTGDRLLPVVEESDYTFFPSAPRGDVRGRVLALFDSLSESGTYQVVALNLGVRDSMQKGNVLGIHQAGARIPDRFSGEPNDSVRLPNELIGRAMVFRVFDRVSYALIMNASRPVRAGDLAASPPRDGAR